MDIRYTDYKEKHESIIDSWTQKNKKKINEHRSEKEFIIREKRTEKSCWWFRRTTAETIELKMMWQPYFGRLENFITAEFHLFAIFQLQYKNPD